MNLICTMVMLYLTTEMAIELNFSIMSETVVTIRWSRMRTIVHFLLAADFAAFKLRSESTFCLAFCRVLS